LDEFKISIQEKLHRSKNGLRVYSLWLWV
jgi:hypothetical protein